MKFIRRKRVCEKTGLSYPTIYRKERVGEFPARRRLGPNSVAWIEDEIDAWMAARAQVAPLAEKSVQK